LKRDVFAPALYVFSNARHDRIRILYWPPYCLKYFCCRMVEWARAGNGPRPLDQCRGYWERNGLVLWSKRLGQQRFIWPRMADGHTVSMSGGEINQLLDGFDVWAQGHRELRFKRVG